MRRSSDEADLCALMSAAQAGDAEAYERVLNAIVPVVRGAIRRQYPRIDATDLEDIVQETLLSIHQVRATYDPARPFLPWVAAIARNRAIDQARRHGRRARNEAADTPAIETFLDETTNRTDDSPGDPAALHHAIATLPAGQRQAVEMLKLKEMTLKEASAATGTSIAALKVACHRGIKALRAALTPES